MRRTMRYVFCFVVTMLGLSLFALPGPTDHSFLKGAMFTVAGYTNENGTARSEPLSGFPVLVRISEDSPSGFSYADLASSTGDDLCFIDMDGTGLPFEIDTWDTNSTSLIWVRLPTMQNGTEFVMCWGGGTSGKNVCGDSPFSNYVGVWHMSESSGTVADSSGHSLPATPSGSGSSTMSVAVSGPVGNGRQLSTNITVCSYLSVPSYDSSNVDNTFAVSGWFNVSTNQTVDGRLFSRKENWEHQNGWEVVWKSSKAFSTRGAHKDANAQYNTAFGEGWKHFFIVYNGSTSTIFENGVQKANKTGGRAATDNNKSLSIGSYSGGTDGSTLVGSVDECRLLDTVPGADWAWAEYASMVDAAFLTAGEAQSYGGTFPPAVSIAVTDRQYTNASFTVSVGSIGTGGVQADVSVAFSASDTLANPLWTTNYTVHGVDAQSVSLAGLATGTTYYMQAQIVNDQNVTNKSPVVTLATLAPGAPAGTAAFDERGFTMLAATGATTAFGTGGESAAMRLEASTDGFETVAAFSPEVVAAIDALETFTISGLSPGTAYALRLCITNNWGVAATVALPDATTRAVPFATTGIGWAFSPDGSMVDITFGVSSIYDSAMGSATLYYGESADPTASQGERPVNTAGDLSWRGLPVSASTMYAKVVLSATLNGQTYSQTNEAPIVSGSTAVSVSDIMEHASAATAVRVRPGDVVTLPELSGTARYLVGNKLFGSLKGNVLTALRPGILGIHCVGNDGATNTMAVLVLPEKIGNGDIYIFKDERIKDNWGYWNEAANWEKLGSETNDSWPHNPDDIAIVAYYKNTGVQFDARDEAVELAELYAGGYRDDKASITLRCATSGKKNKYSFRRTDGKPALVQLCSSSTYLGNNTYRTTLTFGDKNNNILGVEFLSDTVLSGGWDGTNPNFPQGRFEFSAPTNRIADDVTVTLVEMDTQGQSMRYTTYLGNLSGGGTFWNRSAAMVRIGGDSGSFTGLLRDSGGRGAGTTDRTGPMFVRTSTTTNCTGETIGWVPRSGGEPDSDFTRGIGCFQTGGTHSYQVPDPHDPWFTKKGFSMHGGMLRIGSDGTTAWGTRPDKRLVDFFRVGGGFNYIHGYNNNANNNVAWFEADAVFHEGTGTLRIRDQSLFESAATNMVTILRGVLSHAVGGTGDPATGSDYPIVPWIATQAGSKAEEDMRFAAFDGNGRLVRIAHAADKNKSLSDYGANDNAYLWEKGISLSADTTFNSLSIANDKYSKQLGEGRTLRLSSGGLILEDVSWMDGSSGIGTEDGGVANGALVLGDVMHPAYVWARGADTVSEKAGPNEIWAPVTASGGFVAAHTGALILGGNQTGIANEIAVNAGVLQLGTADNSCLLAKDLPIRIFANATLKLPNASSTTGNILKFDGAAGWFGKVEVPSGVAAKCRKAYWRDYPESPEWQNIKRGIFTGDEATALATGAIYDPDRFTGAGTLEVLKDDITNPLILRIR